MKLPYRIDGIEDVELREMSGADLAEVRRLADNGDIYSSFLSFATSCTKSLGGVEDRSQIREMYRNATFDTVYAVAVFGMALTRGVFKIEGMYKCKCGAVVDHTGDFSDPLPTYESEDANNITVDAHVSISDKKSGDVVLSTEKLTMRLPVMDDLIKAYRKYPDDESQMQFEVYKNCLVAVDGNPYKETGYGDLIFKKMSYGELAAVSKALNRSFGKTECVCMKCKRRWKADLDLGRFFDYEAD